MMTDPETQIQYDVDPNMIVIAQAILNAKLRVAGPLLEEYGVIEVGIVNIDTEEEARGTTRSPSSDPARLTPPVPAHPSRAGSSPPSTMGPVTPRSPFDPDDDRTLEYEAPGSPSDMRGLSAEFPEGDSPYQVTRFPSERLRSAADEYRELLTQVVTAARQNRLLTRSFDLSGLAESLDGDSVVDGRRFDEHTLFNSDWWVQRNRDRKVGAAGELFVSFIRSALTETRSANRGFLGL